MTAPASGPAGNEYDHPSIAAAYDAENAWGRDDDFFLVLAAETPGSRLLDLGCGTGRLTMALAAAGHDVTGVDPARAMLEVARTKAGAEKVTWIAGTAASAPAQAFDLALMTSHVAQVFVDDAEWAETLRALAGALAPGGRLRVRLTRPERAGLGRLARRQLDRRRRGLLHLDERAPRRLRPRSRLDAPLPHRARAARFAGDGRVHRGGGVRRLEP